MHVRVVDRSSLSRFIRLPWAIYRGDPRWVPPLIGDVKWRLDESRNAYYEHSRLQLFLCVDGRKTLGRIACVVNDRHNATHGEKTAFFALFESVDDFEAARVLYSSAEQWCRDRGMTRLLGPMLNIDDECGFLVENFNAEPAFATSYNPPYYAEFCERYGFEKLRDLYAWRKDYTTVGGERINRIAARCRDRANVTIRPLNLRRFEEEIATACHLCNASFTSHWGFVPLTLAEVRQMAGRLREVIDPDLFLFAEVDGVPAALCIVLPDYNPAFKPLNGNDGWLSLLRMPFLKKRITGTRAFVFAIRPEYRHLGLAAILWDAQESTIRRLGYRSCEISWTLEEKRDGQPNYRGGRGEAVQEVQDL